MAIRPLLDNDAVLVIGIDDASGPGHGGPPIRLANAVLIGVRDGGGSLLHGQRDEGRYFPVSRGRVDWLGATGELLPQGGPEPFGEAMLVEVRSLPDAPGVTRTFGDKVLFRNDTVCVYEEILGPRRSAGCTATRLGSSSRSRRPTRRGRGSPAASARTASAGRCTGRRR